jgi:hypothetical protein
MTSIQAQYLSAARVICPTDHALNSFAFEKRRNFQFRYNFGCTHLKNVLKSITLKTQFDLWGWSLPNYGSINFLVTRTNS